MKRISSKEAKELNKNFVKTRSKAIKKSIGKSDNLSTWFSIHELKKFIAEVEQEGNDIGITVNGIRVYFGAYPKDDKQKKKENMSTVFMVPTKPYAGSMQKDGGEGDEGGNDIEGLGALNLGNQGWPPNAEYPQ
jgi:hypothetical protein